MVYLSCVCISNWGFLEKCMDVQYANHNKFYKLKINQFPFNAYLWAPIKMVLKE